MAEVKHRATINLEMLDPPEGILLCRELKANLVSRGGIDMVIEPSNPKSNSQGHTLQEIIKVGKKCPPCFKAGDFWILNWFKAIQENSPYHICTFNYGFGDMAAVSHQCAVMRVHGLQLEEYSAEELSLVDAKKAVETAARSDIIAPSSGLLIPRR